MLSSKKRSCMLLNLVFKNVCLLVLFLSCLSCKNSINKDVVLYKSINEVFNDKIEIEDRVDNYLTDDKIIDQAYVIRQLNTNQRHLVILKGVKDDLFEVLVNSSLSIKNVNNQNDRFLELNAKKQELKIVHLGDDNCIIEHEFQYNQNDKGFILSAILKKCNDEQLNEYFKSEKFGKVNLIDFNIEKQY